jgi:uncharacterized membrane protein
MRSEPQVLDRHFQHWRLEGLITAEQEARLREASTTLQRRSAGTVLRITLASLGGGLLLAGLILIVAENWGAIPRFAKLTAWASLQCGLLYLAHELGRRFKGRAYLAEALTLVASGWVLGGIALVSQIYHLGSRPPNGLWLWLVLLLPAAWLLERRATAGAVFLALATALALEVTTLGSWLHAARSESPWLFLAIPIVAAAVASWLPHPARSLGSWVGGWVFCVSNVFLLVFGASQHLDRTSLGGSWALVGASAVFVLARPARVLPAAWDAPTARLVPLLAVLPWALIGSQYDRGELVDLLAVGLAWVLQLGSAVWVIRSAARAGSPLWINLGYLALLAGILTRYFDFFGDYLEGGAALVATGVLLLFVLYSLERARRRSLDMEALA